jgi:hypothetical protein
MKESYYNMHLLVKHIQYDSYSWHICEDLKVITHLCWHWGKLNSVVFSMNETSKKRKSLMK